MRHSLRTTRLPLTLAAALATGALTSGLLTGPPPSFAADDVAGLATRVIEQGMQAELRPSLPATIPTVAEMVDQIAEVYRRTDSSSDGTAS